MILGLSYLELTVLLFPMLLLEVLDHKPLMLLGLKYSDIQRNIMLYRLLLPPIWALFVVKFLF
jgi:hypothetical protein